MKSIFYLLILCFIQPLELKSQSVERDDFDKTTWIRGIEKGDDIRALSKRDFGYRVIRTLISNTGALNFHQVYVTNTYEDDWRFWNRAINTSGRRLEFTPIDKGVDYSDFYEAVMKTEDFAITIPDLDLRRSVKTGYKFKVYSRFGPDFILELTSDEIKSHLLMVDSVRNSYSIRKSK